MTHGIDYKPVVLYVDDIKANLMLFEASFNDDFIVILADSGKAALDILREKEIHVIVSDQNMPGMTGNELLEIVTREYPDIMRFMITAYTDYETVVEAINKGHLYGFFNKPYTIKDVKLSIYKSLEVRNLRLKNKEMIEKLARANEAMLRLDQSKTRFLNSVTDEIRNPINKIMTAVHMIKDKIDSQELTELLQILDVSVRRLEGFSDSARHLVRLNNPDYKLKTEQVSLKEIIEIGIIERGNSIKIENIAVKLSEKADDRIIQGEYDLIQASFSSILGYLIEHVSGGAQIFINIQSVNQGTNLSVTTEKGGYSEKEIIDLNNLSSEKQGNIEKDLRMEIVLASEIMVAHNGYLKFFIEGAESGFSMFFPN